MDGLSLEDLAGDGGRTIDAVSSKLARARRAFREAFERIDQTHPKRRARIPNDRRLRLQA